MEICNLYSSYSDFNQLYMTSKLNDNFFREGFNLTIENAKSLIRISNKASEMNDFGIACSLNILASEESLKALFLIIKHYHPNGIITNFDKIFRLHTVKHAELKQVVIFQDIIQEANKKILTFLEPVLIMINEMSDEYKIKNIEIINALKEDYYWYKKEGGKKLNFGEILSWLKHANNDKNKGLYVDNQNNKWVSPKEITQSKFDKEKKYTEAIIDYVLGIDELFLRVEKLKTH